MLSGVGIVGQIFFTRNLKGTQMLKIQFDMCFFFLCINLYRNILTVATGSFACVPGFY